MNFKSLLSNLKKDFGKFNQDDVTSMRFDMLPHGDKPAMYATVTMANGKVHEGWTDEATPAETRKFAASDDRPARNMAKDIAEASMKAPNADSKAVKAGEDENNTGLPLSELQPENVAMAAGEVVGSKDGDVFPEPVAPGVPANTGNDPHTTVVPPTGTTETAYPAGQKPVNSKQK